METVKVRVAQKVSTVRIASAVGLGNRTVTNRVQTGGPRLTVQKKSVTVKVAVTGFSGGGSATPPNLFVGVAALPTVGYPALALKDVGGGMLELWVTDGA